MSIPAKHLFYTWGRLGPARSERILAPWRGRPLPFVADRPHLAIGIGRSYGDSALLTDGCVIDATAQDRLISFDPETGILTAEGGITFDALLRFAVPRGWFLPTTPGTRFVTLAGAIANDIHGKNHHQAGTIGNHITEFSILRSDGSAHECSREKNTALFEATIGGLGLTGLITTVSIRLVAVESSWISQHSEKFSSLEEYAQLSDTLDAHHEHSVAWIDCVSQGKGFGRGILMVGNAASREEVPSRKNALEVHRPPGLSVPCNAPGWALNPFTVLAFNELYYRKQFRKQLRNIVHYGPFFYPLDAINDWNRIYGRRGFFQYQTVVPPEGGIDAVGAMLKRVTHSGQASFLAVLKKFGDVPSPGLLSFPRPGYTLALDLPNRGEDTMRLMNDLDLITREAGGAWYPAKDARMSRADFEKSYPRLPEFLAQKDPGFSSDFWQRLDLDS